MEIFYEMFSKLLDKKVEEIRGVIQAETRQQISDNDIPDDYIEIIQPQPSPLLTVPDLVTPYLNVILFLTNILFQNQEIEPSRGRRIRSENFHSHRRAPPSISKIFPKEYV